MTTPIEGNGGDQPDVPYLPPSQPAAPRAPAPTVPSIPSIPSDPSAAPEPTAPSAPPPADPTAFDAHAMVEAQKHYTANPAYGALPAQTDAGREAARRLRSQAQRKRRRNQLVGRVVALLLLGGVGAAGWFGYQEYRDQQDRDAAERAAAEADQTDGAPGGIDDAIGALTPLGEEQQILDGMNDLNATAQAGAGGLLDAVRDAREIVGQADPFTVRTVDFVYRQWETASAASSMIEYGLSYDRLADTYQGNIRSADTRMVIGTTAEWRAAIYPDGVVERVPRSAASLEPTVDVALGAVLVDTDVIPPAARPFATLVESQPDAASGALFGYTIDTEAWRDRDPGSFLAWVDTWNPRPVDHPSFVDATRREVSADETDTSDLRSQEPPLPLFDVGDRDLPGAGVIYVIDPDGYVIAAVVVDTTADFRTEYVLSALGDQPASMDLGDQNWTAAPTP